MEENIINIQSLLKFLGILKTSKVISDFSLLLLFYLPFKFAIAKVVASNLSASFLYIGSWLLSSIALIIVDAPLHS